MPHLLLSLLLVVLSREEQRLEVRSSMTPLMMLGELRMPEAIPRDATLSSTALERLRRSSSELDRRKCDVVE